MVPISAAAETRALLIGIDRYDRLPSSQQLEAPVNDVRRVRTALEAAGLKADYVQALTGRVPLEAMRGALDRLAVEATAKDAVLIYYSGHGGRRRGGVESDGLEEGLVASDARLDGDGLASSGFLADAELLVIVDRIRAAGADVWLVVDACHAAGVVRGGDRRKGLGSSVRSASVRHGPPAAAGPVAGAFTAFFAASVDAAALERPARPGDPAASYFTLALARAIDSGRLVSYRDLAAGLMAQDGRLGVNAPRPEFFGDLDRPVLDLVPGPQRRFAVRAGTPARMSAGSEEGLARNDAVALEAADGTPLGSATVLRSDLGEAWLESAPAAAVAGRWTATAPTAGATRSSRLLSAVQALGGRWQPETVDIAAWRWRPEAGCDAFVDPEAVPPDAASIDLWAAQPFEDCDILIVEARNTGASAVDINLLYASGDGTVVTPSLYPEDSPRTSPGTVKRVALRLRADAAGGDRLVLIATPVRSRFALDLRYLAGATVRGGPDSAWFAHWLDGRFVRSETPAVPPPVASVLAAPIAIRVCDRECKAARASLPRP